MPLSEEEIKRRQEENRERIEKAHELKVQQMNARSKRAEEDWEKGKHRRQSESDAMFGLG